VTGQPRKPQPHSRRNARLRTCARLGVPSGSPEVNDACLMGMGCRLCPPSPCVRGCAGGPARSQDGSDGRLSPVERESPTWVGTACTAAQSCSPTVSAAQTAAGAMGAEPAPSRLRCLRCLRCLGCAAAPATESESPKAPGSSESRARGGRGGADWAGPAPHCGHAPHAHPLPAGAAGHSSRAVLGPYLPHLSQ
jgi:hypothetical protein